MVSLHMIAHPSCWAAAWQQAQSQDQFLLIEDGCYLALEPLPAAVWLRALDMQQRGLGQLQPKRQLDEQQWLALTAELDRCLSWYP